MTEIASDVVYPVPRWVRAWSIFTLILAIVLIALGGFVTSFRVGMSDPVPFTEPWYLFLHDNLDLGFRIEHVHRLTAWALGGAVVLLAVGAFAYERNRLLRRLGLIAVILLVGAYGEFRRGLSGVWDGVKQKAENEYRLDPRQQDYESQLVERKVTRAAEGWPVLAAVATAAFAIAVLAVGGFAAASGRPGGWLRAAAATGLVFVMIQGLLGGFRVFLNALVGADLAAAHGVFAQVTFTVLVAAAVFAAPRRPGDWLPTMDRPRLMRRSVALIALLFLQLIWGVMVRHQGSPLGQRLHILTAFVVTGLTVWLAVAILTRPAAKARFAGPAYYLLALLALQLVLGVEAYLGKFAAVGADAIKPPMERAVTATQAAGRTAHLLIGSGLLATAVGLALWTGRQEVVIADESPMPDDQYCPEPKRDTIATVAL